MELNRRTTVDGFVWERYIPKKMLMRQTHGNQDGTAYNTFLKGNVFLYRKQEEMNMFEFMTIRELY